MLLRVHQHHAILVEESLVALDEDRKIALVLEREPRTPIREDVGVHRPRAIKRRSHPLAGVAIPRALGLVEVNPRHLPQLKLGHVRAALVAARYKWCLRRLHLLEGLGDVLT